MQTGAIITKGIQNWQIIQQKNGTGVIHLKGVRVPDTQEQTGTGLFQVYARIVEEDTGDVVIPWTSAEHFGENQWECTFASVPAGGLYRIETCLRQQEDTPLEWACRGDVVNHVGVGDLFVIAGQSNSAGYGKDTVYDPPELGVHVYRNSDRWDLAVHPLNDSTGSRREANREPANTGHSPYLAFAKYLKRKVGYPLGLIPCALGGSAMERWNPDEIGDLYRNMMERISEQGNSVTGILWYQGCTDAMQKRYQDYQDRFFNMVNHIRNELKDPELPVFTYQLGRYTDVSEYSVDEGWSVIREQQRQAAYQEGIYVLPTLDGMISDCIHNNAPFNIVLGERMAKQALNVLYHRTYFADAPDIRQNVQTGETTILLEFSNVYDHLETFGVAVEDLPFVVEDSSGINPVLKYRVVNNTCIELELERPVRHDSVVSCSPGRNPKGRIPADYANHYPILAFYRIPVKGQQ